MERKRIDLRAGIAALAMVVLACGDEETPKSSNNNDDDDETQDEGEPGGKAEADAGPLDAIVPPTFDGTVTLPPVDVGGDSAVDLPPVPPPDGVSALTSLQHDGQLKSVCYSDLDCIGENLGCRIPVLASPLVERGPGTCVTVCFTDEECAPIEGVPGTCNIGLVEDGFCEYGCGGTENDGTGPCPKDMECRNFGTTLTAALPNWLCAYPVGGGKKNEPLYGRCDASHGPGDCAGENICAHPAASVASLELAHGYCSPKCTQDTDCVAPGGATAVGSCFLNECRFECETDEACPTGMSCFSIGPLGVPVNRCVYLD